MLHNQRVHGVMLATCHVLNLPWMTGLLVELGFISVTCTLPTYFTYGCHCDHMLIVRGYLWVKLHPGPVGLVLAPPTQVNFPGKTSNRGQCLSTEIGRLQNFLENPCKAIQPGMLDIALT